MKRIFALLLLLSSATAFAEVGGYRVEVILFQNLQANLDAVEVDSLRSYSNVPELTESNLPDDLEVLTDRSQRMEGVWNRLRSSQGYRPLLYSSWVQNNIDYYPPFRIHDDTVIDTQIKAPTAIVIADLQAQDPFQAFRSNYYLIDGSVQLRLSRFLHINLDLEYRVPTQRGNREVPTAPDISSDPAAVNGIGANGPGTAPINNQPSMVDLQNLPEYDVYRLKQSRQVKTDRLQYFDSPYFGVLIMVIPIAAEPLPQLPLPTQTTTAIPTPVQEQTPNTTPAQEQAPTATATPTQEQTTTNSQ